MSVTTDHDAPDVEVPDGPPEGSPWLSRILVGIIVVALVAASFAVGMIVRGGASDSDTPIPPDSSVDVGFARDMITHHNQAIEMAGLTRNNSTDPDIRLLAFDIETGQLAQAGQMEGWLQVWGKNPNNPDEPMSWMPASESHMDHTGSGLMPGMATPDEMSKLRATRGKALDILFLQYMIRHHQGGIPMAQYAADHATQPVVRDLALKMVKQQSAEVINMEQSLRKLGATPLPPPA